MVLTLIIICIVFKHQILEWFLKDFLIEGLGDLFIILSINSNRFFFNYFLFVFYLNQGIMVLKEILANVTHVSVLYEGR